MEGNGKHYSVLPAYYIRFLVPNALVNFSGVSMKRIPLGFDRASNLLWVILGNQVPKKSLIALDCSHVFGARQWHRRKVSPYSHAQHNQSY